MTRYFMHCNFVRILHQTFRVTPATAAYVTDKLWSFEDVLCRGVGPGTESCIVESNMTAKDIVGIVVRVVGLFLLAMGIYSLIVIAIRWLGFRFDTNSSVPTYFIFGIVYSMAGFVIVRNAEWIERFCYPSKSRSDSI